MLDKNSIYLFDDLMDCNKQILMNFKRKKNTTVVSLNDLNVTKKNKVLLYYTFLQANKDNMLVENPVQWVMEDFKD